MENNFKPALQSICDEMQYFFDTVTTEERCEANSFAGKPDTEFWGTGSGGFKALENYLVDNNYNVLGKGNYSIVIECPWSPWSPEYAIKIGHGGAGRGDIQEDGWLSWAAFCMQQDKLNIYPRYMLPKIHDILFNRNIYIALMERYYCTYEDYDGGYIVLPDSGDDALVDLRYKALKLARAMYKGNIPTVEFHDGVVQDYLRVFRDPNCPSITDLHDGNIMINAENMCLVIIDPSSEDYTINKSDRLELFSELGINIGQLLN